MTVIFSVKYSRVGKITKKAAHKQGQSFQESKQRTNWNFLGIPHTGHEFMKVSIHKKLILNIIVRLKILLEALKSDSVVTVKIEMNFF